MGFTGGGDLVSGGYPLGYNWVRGLGYKPNATQSNIAPRSNFEPGFVTFGTGTVQDGGALTSTDMTLVPVPVQYGDAYNYVDVFVGATAASTLTHFWAQLYSGVLTTLKAVATQSTDTGAAAVAASAAYTFTLGAEYIANPTDSPYGFLYVAIGVTASTAPSLISGTLITAAQYAFYTDSPPFFSGYISASTGTAPATVTVTSVTKQTPIPLVCLR